MIFAVKRSLNNTYRLLNILECYCNHFNSLFLAESEFQNSNVGGKQIENLCRCQFWNKFNSRNTMQTNKQQPCFTIFSSCGFFCDKYYCKCNNCRKKGHGCVVCTCLIWFPTGLSRCRGLQSACTEIIYLNKRMWKLGNAHCSMYLFRDFPKMSSIWLVIFQVVRHGTTVRETFYKMSRLQTNIFKKQSVQKFDLTY